MTKTEWNNILTYGAYESELEWFAMDKNGYLGMFTAIMNAPIAEQIKKSFELYTKLKNIINNLPNTSSALQIIKGDGDFSDWLNYSQKGLFSFDYQDIHRVEKLDQYDLVSQPSKPISIDELDIEKQLIEIVPQLGCSFQEGNLKTQLIS